MPAPNGTAIKYKAVVFGCSTCGNRRRFILSEEEANYLHAQFLDKEEFLVFNAFDLTARHLADEGRFSQTLRTAAVNDLQVFEIDADEMKAIRETEEAEAKAGSAVRPITKISLGGVKLK
ncbi:MAG: hypothetical protein V4671_02315 [Armatimonadota bacterium]